MATTNLKTILTQKGINQGDLANKAGLSSAYVNRVVNGKRTPAPVTAYKILNALNSFPNIDPPYTLKDIFPTIKE